MIGYLCGSVISGQRNPASWWRLMRWAKSSMPFTKLFFSFEYWGKLLDKSKSKTQNRHETEPAFSPQNWTSVFMNRNSVFFLCLPTFNWKFYRAAFVWKSVFSSRTTRANPVFKSSISNWRFSRQRFLTELNECVYHAVKPLEQSQCSKHKSDLFATELNKRVQQSN